MLRTLETNGVLGQLRAELRANVYKAIDTDEDGDTGAASVRPLGEGSRRLEGGAKAKLTKSPVGQLMAEIVAEFFEFYHFRLEISRDVALFISFHSALAQLVTWRWRGSSAGR